MPRCRTRARSTIRADRLEVIVSFDGATDGTAERARAAGADVVIENPRGGKVRAQDAAVRAPAARSSPSRTPTRPGSPARCARSSTPSSTRASATSAASVRFTGANGATNQEGLYWRYEMWVRGLESRLASVTAGNGAIYATRKDAYIVVDPLMGHDLSFPFNMVKRGWRAVYAPAARATEKMVPDRSRASSRASGG